MKPHAASPNLPLPSSSCPQRNVAVWFCDRRRFLLLCRAKAAPSEHRGRQLEPAPASSPSGGQKRGAVCGAWHLPVTHLAQGGQQGEVNGVPVPQQLQDAVQVHLVLTEAACREHSVLAPVRNSTQQWGADRPV